jgi:hypothetical protein
MLTFPAHTHVAHAQDLWAVVVDEVDALLDAYPASFAHMATPLAHAYI